ncbi:Alkali-sensitive linkage protein [Lachnellula hyalina]|uniref:Alkali-sensitive linkage protein n=1 Tax=Lachnellula hyalina TaxID=1316788 RepID=A0A8H8QXW2_9HELO|nr:Alkali-sensitive linkage protein [Lachnellula hyalina]TVY24773.1 Alkali-sensitive linkage protein [Lachnellula hyalina]
MHLKTSTLLLAAASFTTAQTTSSKRGLVFVPNPKHPTDNQIWVEGASDLTWYYNYATAPSPAYQNRTQSDFQYVPMLFSPSSTFQSEIETLITNGRNISHVMTYNEPDGESSTGGSSVSPVDAATNWIAQVEPLRAKGVKTGAPAVTGGEGGFTWLKSFFAACQSQGTNCTADFIPIHWYGNFAGLASHIGEVVATYPNTSIWITEYALNNATLPETQDFYNTSAQYYDRLDYVDRYSYFGSFRSDVSNVGPNVAMLNNKGELTDIGSWYLGGKATGNKPGGSGAGRTVQSSWLLVVCVVVGFLITL